MIIVNLIMNMKSNSVVQISTNVFMFLYINLHVALSVGLIYWHFSALQFKLIWTDLIQAI